MTKIQEMVEWLDKNNYFEALEKARRLADEEAKEKPTAPASQVDIVGELKEYCEGRGVCDCRRILEIIRKYEEGK